MTFIKTISQPPSISKITKNVKTYKTADNFLKIVLDLAKEDKHFAAFLKNLDAYDSITYNHSINVGLQTYNLLSKESSFTLDELKIWTKAAICHDVGKLEIPLDILNSTLNYRDNPEKFQKEKSVMMSHSIGHSINLGKRYHFTREDMIAALCHHMKANSIENNFKDAILSKREWSELYSIEEFDNLIKNELGTLSNKEIFALETISFCDVCESLRSNDRKYKQQKEWNDTYDYDKDNQLILNNLNVPQINKGILTIIKEDCENKSLHPKYQRIVNLESFRNHFDQLQKLNLPAATRNNLRDLTKNIPFTLSDHKINQIKENPILGKQFQVISDLKYFTFEKGNGERFSFPREHELKDYSNMITRTHKDLIIEDVLNENELEIE